MSGAYVAIVAPLIAPASEAATETPPAGAVKLAAADRLGYPPIMQIFIFQSSADPILYGFTRQPDGGNLPPDLGPWKPSGNTALQAGDSGEDDPVLAGIETDGFYLGRITISAGDAP